MKQTTLNSQARNSPSRPLRGTDKVDASSAFDVYRRGDNLRSGYSYYCGRCKQEGITPLSFRVWARMDTDYDLDWEIEGYEYDHAG